MPHPGAVYAVSGIYERDRRLLEFLEARGIRPGAKLRLLERNYDQTLTLSTRAGNVSLGRAAAERVWVSGSDQRLPAPLTPGFPERSQRIPAHIFHGSPSIGFNIRGFQLGFGLTMVY